MHHLGYKLVLLIGLVMCNAVTLTAAQPSSLPLANSSAEVPFARWLLMVLGPVGLLAMVAGLVIFVGACLVVILARRPAVIASYLLFLLVPLLLGIICALKGTVSAFSVVAMSDVSLKPSQICGGLAEVLVPILAALMVTFPSYCVIAIGLFVRTIFAGEQRAVRGREAESPFVVASPERK